MNYKIKWCEQKTGKTGKKYTVMTLTDEQGADHDNVSTFDEVVNGGSIEGEIVQNGNFKNFRKSASKGNPAYKQKVMEETMQRKENSISKFQDNKELSIKIASTINKAVELAIAEKDSYPDYDLAQGIKNWRKWLWENWEVDITTYNPF